MMRHVTALAATFAALIPLHAPKVELASAAQGVECQPQPASRALPFRVGEKIEYRLSAKAGVVPVPLSGTGVMEVFSMDTIRQREAFHIRFSVQGGVVGFRVNDQYDSWFDPKTLASLRFQKRIRNPGYKKDVTFEIFPERKQFQEDNYPIVPSVAQPLDEGSFVYFIRSMQLEVGKTYCFDSYFKPERNPVTVQVVGKERINVAGRDWDAILVRPTILTGDKGLFSKDSEARIWLADDSTRIVLQMKANMQWGSSITLSLRSFQPGKGPALPAPVRTP